MRPILRTSAVVKRPEPLRGKRSIDSTPSPNPSLPLPSWALGSSNLILSGRRRGSTIGRFQGFQAEVVTVSATNALRTTPREAQGPEIGESHDSDRVASETCSPSVAVLPLPRDGAVKRLVRLTPATRPKRHDMLAEIESAPVPCRLLLAWERGCLAAPSAASSHACNFVMGELWLAGGRNVWVFRPTPRTRESFTRIPCVLPTVALSAWLRSLHVRITVRARSPRHDDSGGEISRC
jgi:hypothetical protein